MNKIPLGETIRFAYAFAFGQIGAIIGLVWLPLLLAAVLQFLPYAVGTVSVGASTDAMGGALFNLSMALAALLLYAMNCVSVTRLALGAREGAVSIYFSLGVTEWRMFVALLLCGFATLVLLGLYLMAGALLAGLVGMAADLAVAAYAALGLVALSYVSIRLIFLVPPLVVVEGRADLLRAWRLSGGNVGRFLIVLLAVSLPVLVLQALALMAIVGPGLYAPLPVDPNQATAALEARRELLDAHAPSVIGLSLVLSPFNLGLILGALARSYRALVPERPRPG